MSNFDRQSPQEHSCKIISTSVHRFSRRSRLKLISIYSSGGHFVQRRGIVRAVLVEGHPRNIPV